MGMNSRPDQAWNAALARFNTAKPAQSGQYLYRTDEDSKVGTFAGVDAAGLLLFAVETTSTPPALDFRSDAVDYFRQERAELGSWLLVLRLKSPDLKEVFSRLCLDLIDSMSGCSSDKDITDTVVSRIRLWQKLFELRPSGVLELHEIKGLTAELLYMKKQIDTGVRDANETVHAWLGPVGADQDYVFSTGSVEIKAIGPSSERVSISSLQQLCADRPLALSVWTLRQASPTEESGYTLNRLNLEIEQAIGGYPSALALFRDRLLAAGYVQHPSYDLIAFEPINEEVFIVEGSFPRITKDDVPPGVDTAKYTISLQAIREMRRSQYE